MPLVNFIGKGLSAVGTGVGGILSSKGTKHRQRAEEARRVYNNTLADMNAALSKNAVSTNQIRARNAFTGNELAAQQQQIAETAIAQVSAAAEGVTGASVETTLRDIAGAHGRAEYNRTKRFGETIGDLERSKFDIERRALSNKQIGEVVLPTPSVGAQLLGIGGQVVSDLYYYLQE